jgi:hypothetical protein
MCSKGEREMYHLAVWDPIARRWDRDYISADGTDFVFGSVEEARQAVDELRAASDDSRDSRFAIIDQDGRVVDAGRRGVSDD